MQPIAVAGLAASENESLVRLGQGALERIVERRRPGPETIVLTAPRRLCLGVVHTMIAGVMCGEQLAAGLPGMYAGRSQCRGVDDVEAGKSVG